MIVNQKEFLLKLIGGPYKRGVSKSDQYFNEDPPPAFHLFEENNDNLIKFGRFSFGYILVGMERLETEDKGQGKDLLVWVYQYAGREDNQTTARSNEN